MRIYFATNRNADNDADPKSFGTSFSTRPSGLTDLRFGWAETDDSMNTFEIHTAKESLNVGLANAEINNLSGQTLGSSSVFEEIRKDMRTNKQDCVLFIHGFNTNFQDSLKTATRLKKFYSEKPMNFFLFSWPSDGKMIPYMSYFSDREEAKVSGTAVGRGILKLSEFLHKLSKENFCGQKIHIMAHSMGNYVLRNSMQQLVSNSRKNVARLFENILLFAADEDDDAFEYDYKLKRLPDLARRVTVYHNSGDKALIISDITKGNPDRLGAGGPRNSRILPDKVTVVNVEPVLAIADDITSHNYYLSDETVRQDVISVLNGTEPQDIKIREYQSELRTYRLKKKSV